ncbi:hypothetical protein [Microbacterium sp. 22242]|uniref:hypothetical protein n=1 Tax=Microbacterium sp. 22242 TaxID=3453896 RepID=UPI003F86B9AA
MIEKENLGVDVEGAARSGSFAEFRKAYKRGDAKKLFRGQSLVLHALTNEDPAARYEITTFLLDQGAPADGVGFEQENVFHVLFSRRALDPSQTIELTRRLIGAGADPNRPDDRKRTPSEYLTQLALPLSALDQFYDLWFSQPGLDLVSPNVAGISALDSARKIGFTPLIARMESYLDDNA